MRVSNIVIVDRRPLIQVKWNRLAGKVPGMAKGSGGRQIGRWKYSEMAWQVSPIGKFWKWKWIENPTVPS